MNLDRFRVKIIVALVIISSVPLLIFASVIYRDESRLVRDKAISHLETIVTQNAILVEGFCNERVHYLNLLAAITKNLGSEEAIANFKLMQEERKIYKNLFIANTTGTVLFETGPPAISTKSLIRQGWFKSVLGGSVFVSDIEAGNVRGLLVAVPVKSSAGQTIAVIGATINFQDIAATMTDTVIGHTGEVYIVNKNGVFLTTTRVGGGRVGQSMPPEKFAQYFRSANPDEYIDYRGEKVVRVYKELSGPGWFLVGEQDSSEVFGDIIAIRNTFIGFVAFLIVLIMLTGYIATNRMIRLLKAAYKQKKELEMQVIQKDKLASMGLLTAGIAHELNTPLASALLYTQMLKEDVTSSDRSHLEKLSSIEEEIKRSSRIIRSLLEFSRQSQTESTLTDVNDVLGRLLSISERPFHDRGIEIKNSLEKDIPFVKGDASILYQVFTNIFANALEAMDKGGTLSVISRYIKPLRKVTIEIQDTGPGIPEEYMGNIFDPFFTTKSLAEGTGLGLAISYSMIRKMGGNIRATSFYGKKGEDLPMPTGTTFTVELPAHDNDNADTYARGGLSV